MSTINIPRILHYCNFGNGASISKDILDSWSKYCPDYKIMCWDETNFDISCCLYVKEAYQSGKFAFVSDVARLYALKTYGGIYLDTDVELVNGMDSFLSHDLFWGLESKGQICTAVIGATRENRIIKELFEDYSRQHFILEDGQMDLTTNVSKVSSYFISRGFNLDGDYYEKDGIAIYPQEYFSPKDFISGEIKKTDKTCAIHYFSSSWKSEEERRRDELFFKYKMHLPEKLSWNLASYISAVKYRGFIKAHKDMFKLLGGKKHD